MKITFKIIIPVAIMLVLAVSVISFIGYTNISREIKSVMQVTAQSTVEDLLQQIDTVEEDTEKLKNALNNNFLRIARSIAYAVDKNPDLLSTKTMQEMAASIGIDEIHVVDSRGILFAGSVPDFFGFDFSTNEQTKPFLRMLTNPKAKLAQNPQIRAVDGVLFQYIGVPLPSGTGLVQIGVTPKELQNLLESSSNQNIMEQYPYEEGGFAYILSLETKAIINHSIPDRIGVDMSEFDFVQRIIAEKNGQFTYKYEGEEVFTCFAAAGETIVVTAIPTGIYTGRLRPILFSLIFSSFLALLILSGTMFVIVSRIFAPLRKVSHSLREISSGDADLTRRLEITSRDEVGDVAQNFNAFIENLQSLIMGIQVAVSQTQNININLGSSTKTTASSTEEINKNIDSVRNQLQQMDENISESATAMEEITSNTSSFDNMISSQASMVEE
ncbi:HAMP domain-containing protein [Oceanispirochaeta sp.]|jgi:methyl-accepting chemotaxis protein|uniref:HAMP domain-containing protein n=1 Tax=Oceanispirochaeta sp. TaxID=2035350 RepID=UPI0026331ECB|nr:HAMP domain-containing protein [Oceanispirochaeta sp.]MDA3958668.1 HAMP domain-containing protein [Oceanispirochaeta sp.]